MNHQLTSHFLIGPAASGKSTFAKELAATDNYNIVSTDAIRAELFGEERIQGDWQLIETEALNRIKKSLAAGRPVIYDATNTKRPWRMELLNKISQISPPNSRWMAWYLETSLEICLERNRQRYRQVPPEVIAAMDLSLKEFPPIAAEGFIDAVTLKNGNYSIAEITQQIQTLDRRVTNRKNGIKKNTIHHPYSRLLDFDRLFHLLSILIEQPGFSLTEITETIRKKIGAIYADEKALAADLEFLESNYIISGDRLSKLPEILPKIYLQKTDYPEIINHSYSGREEFQRLLTTIRIIFNRPFLPGNDKSNLKGLAETVALELESSQKWEARLRKDIENVLKPYKIIDEKPLKRGYFAGTGILSRGELLKVLDILQVQAKSIENPVALEVCKMFEKRMVWSKNAEKATYPVRAIAHQPMVDIDQLEDRTALCCQTENVEEIILNGELVELGKRRGTGRFQGEKEGFFLAWLLQILFHNSAWYLALEREGGEEPGLIKIERLDRLYLSRRYLDKRSLEIQEASLKKMQKLLNNSAGIHLGTSSQQQRQFLSKKKSDKKKVEVTIKLSFNDKMFKFISEGTKRFPPHRMKMSPPNGKPPSKKGLFSLEKSPDSRFPNCLEVTLPRWCLESIDLLTWLAGFGGQVIVVEPAELREKVRKIGEGIVGVYG
ncbi:MAG: WYL domain-containing protein [Cyanobacteriota bacterium]|nr:WYL domain-containing protein [Cyanobacteriota bacterium]